MLDSLSRITGSNTADSGGIRYFPQIACFSGKHGAITGVTLPGSGAVVSCDLMAFNALLMCREEQALRVLGTALEEVEMEPEVCVSAPEALDLTVVRHYSALVLDFDLPGAATVARMARLAPSSRRPVIFGMIGASTEIAETFQAGVNFIIYKPLAFEQIVRCLRAGRGFMRPDRRQSQRQPLESSGLSAVRHRCAAGHGAGSEPERSGSAGAGTIAAGSAGASAFCSARHH